MDRESDNNFVFSDEKGDSLLVKIVPHGASNWIYVKTNQTGGLDYDNGLARNLIVDSKVDLLGYSIQAGIENNKEKEWEYGYGLTQSNGLMDETVLLKEVVYDTENSGGPVLSEQNGKSLVFGLFSKNPKSGQCYAVPLSKLTN